MTLKEKINFLIVRGYTQQKIDDETGIEQSSVSRILNETQKSVSYEKGRSLDELVAKEKAFLALQNQPA
ncbi:MAG: transcriptional regulator [Acinetobacter junii]